MQNEESLKFDRDLKNCIDTSFEEGFKLIQAMKTEEIAQVRAETAKTLKASGIELEIIMRSTGLSAEDINKL